MDFTQTIITPNLEAFLKRYPELVQEALASAEQQIRNAKTRVNASNARLIKARIEEPANTTKEQLDYHKNCAEQIEAVKKHYDIHTWAQKYLDFLLAPENDYIRHDLDQEYAEWTTFEDVVYNINDVYLHDMLEAVEYDCNCGASNANYQHGLYFNTYPERHIYIDYKGTCSHGTKMTLVDKDYLLNSLDFIENPNIDSLKLEVF